MVTVMMTQFKTKTDAAGGDQKSCLSFRYRRAPEKPKYAERIRLGTEILSWISTELAKLGYAVSASRKGSFGITSMSCSVGQISFAIAVWPPTNDSSDVWQVRTSLSPPSHSHPAGADVDACSEVLDTVSKVLASREGITHPRQISRELAEKETQ
jgi:hypothetical protein